MLDRPAISAGVFDPSSASLLDPPLTDVQTSMRDGLHRFADEVMRPAGRALDRMTADEVIAKGSPFYAMHEQYRAFGLNQSALAELPAQESALLQSIAYEEMGWGDSGLAISVGVNAMPASVARVLGVPEFAERFPETKFGCWAITEPDHGSDMLDSTGQAFASNGQYGRPSCLARRVGGDIVLSGQKSAWVSNGAVAEQAVLFSLYDDGKTGIRGCVLYVPLGLKGVSRGRPLEKLGQRALPQGEIFFDEVKLPVDCLAAGPDEYHDALYDTLCLANSSMGSLFVGVARAAFEHALAYAHERKQGGVPIFQHQNVKARLFSMYRKVEAARALARRVAIANATAATPALQGAIASKITATQTAFEVASEAIQIFGGAGMSREYPVEKLLRDARASMIEDGCNELLAIKGGSQLINAARAN
jgi:acyl-CoA dehydrogenase